MNRRHWWGVLSDLALESVFSDEKLLVYLLSDNSFMVWEDPCKKEEIGLVGIIVVDAFLLRDGDKVQEILEGGSLSMMG